MKEELLNGLRLFFTASLLVLITATQGAWAEDITDQAKNSKSVALPGHDAETTAKAAEEFEEPVEIMTGMGGKDDNEYIMLTGDRIKITIYPEDEHIKGAEMEISSEGNITLPLVGKIQVAGKKPIEAEKEISVILDRDYLVNPEVVIEVTDKYASEKDKSVVLLGQVKQPGTQPFPKAGRFTLLQAIAIAGGFSDVANIKKIKVIRGGEVKGEVLRANAEDIISGKKPDIDLEDGDIINVAESLF